MVLRTGLEDGVAVLGRAKAVSPDRVCSHLVCQHCLLICIASCMQFHLLYYASILLAVLGL